jgi:RNA polymerase sigma factor (sigma-70 family)
MPASALAVLTRRLLASPGTVPDADLLERYTRDRDPAAFELLVRRYGAMVWGVCHRLLAPDRHSAEDACQAVFLALTVHADRVRDQQSLGAWLHRVAVRACLDLRATCGRGDRTAAPLLDTPDREPGPHQLASDRELAGLIDAAVNHLPDRLRVAFVLCELEGRSNAEAAALLGCPVGTIESRLTRARQRLRQWLSARGVTPAAVLPVALPRELPAELMREVAGIGQGSSSPAAWMRELANRAVPPSAAKPWTLTVTGLVLAVSLVGVGLATHPGKEGVGRPTLAAPPQGENRPRAEGDGQPLPAGALARLGSPNLRHAERVTDVCFSADGRLLASCGWDKAVRVWDGRTGRQRFAVRRPEGGFDRVAFVGGTREILAGGYDGQKKYDLWRIDAKGKVTGRWTLDANRDPYAVLRFQPDGARLAVGTADTKQLLVYDTTTGRLDWKADLAGQTPRGLDFAPGGATVAVATQEGTVTSFDRAGKTVGVLKADKARFNSLALAPDGAVVACDQSRKRLFAWAGPSGKLLWQSDRPSFNRVLAFSPDGKALVCSDLDYHACTVDPADGLPCGLDGKKGATFQEAVFAVGVAFRPDGRAVALGASAGTIRLYDRATGEPATPTADPPREVNQLKFTPDGRTLHGWASGWFAWDPATGRQRRVTTEGGNYGKPLSPDGRLTVGVEAGGKRLEVRRAADGKVLHSHPTSEAFGVPLAFTPDSRSLLLWSGSHPDTALVVDVASGNERARVSLGVPREGTSMHFALSPSGRMLALGAARQPTTEKSPVRVFDLVANRLLGQFETARSVGLGGVSDDGRRVAVFYGSEQGLPPTWWVAVCDVATGKEQRVTLARGERGLPMALDPHGRVLALAQHRDHEAAILVFEVASGTERFVFRHEGGIPSLAFHPNGKVLAAASPEVPVYLWDVAGKLEGKPAWDPKGTDRLWQELGVLDAKRAFRAIHVLKAHPREAIPFLRERTRPPVITGTTLKSLLADLDAEEFTRRQRATDTLAGYGEAVREALLAEQKRSPSVEVRRRVQRLLDRLTGRTPERLQRIRAVEAVEGMETEEARALLRTWAGGGSGPTLAAEAEAAVRRARPAPSR